MPNGGEHYERLGACPLCGSLRIRIRRQRHSNLLWRCRRCNRVFTTPKVADYVIPPGDDGSGYVFAESIPQMERRGRLLEQQGGQRGPRRSIPRILTAVIVLVILLGAAGLFIYMAGLLGGGNGSARVPESDRPPVAAVLPSSTPKPAPTLVSTATPSSIVAQASVPAAIPTDTPIATPIMLPSSTPKPAPTATITPTPSSKLAQTSIATAIPTDTPVAEPTNLPTKTPTATPMPTAVPQISPTPVSATPSAAALTTFENGGWLVQNRPSLAASIVAIDWIEDGIGASESEAVQEVVTLAAFHEVLTSSLIDRPWVID